MDKDLKKKKGWKIKAYFSDSPVCSGTSWKYYGENRIFMDRIKT